MRRAGRRNHPARYGHELGPLIPHLWEFSDHACSKLLALLLSILVAALEGHGGLRLPSNLRAQLVGLSPATLAACFCPLGAASAASGVGRRPLG